MGEWGEQQALSFLLHQKFLLLDQNCRYKLHEIDLVMMDSIDHEVVFVEVKTRHSAKFGEPTLAVNQRKLHSLIKAAEIYLQEKKLDLDYRFDIVTVVVAAPTSGTSIPDINHYRNVTWEMVK